MRDSWYAASGAERGLTLLDLIVYTTLLGVVLAMAYGILNSGVGTIKVIGDEATNATNARIALTELEANLRYADGFWISGSGSTLTVENSPLTSFVGQQPCTQWTLASPGLTEATASTLTGPFGTPTLMMPGVTGLSFTAPLSGLARIDLTVNQDPKKPADAITVHDLISPDNLKTSYGLAVTGACT